MIQCEVAGIRCIAIFGAGKMKFIKLQSKHISNRSDIDDNDDDDQQQCVYPTKRTVSQRSNKHAKPHVVRLGMCVCLDPGSLHFPNCNTFSLSFDDKMSRPNEFQHIFLPVARYFRNAFCTIAVERN